MTLRNGLVFTCDSKKLDLLPMKSKMIIALIGISDTTIIRRSNR